MNLQSLTELAGRLRLKHQQALGRVQTEQAALAALEAELGHTVTAQQALQTIAQAIQQSAHGRIANIVTRCHEAVFDDPYELKIIFERKRGKTEAQLTFERDGLVLENPRQEAGIGTIDVASFGLRLSDLLLRQPARRRFIVLDEPFHFLHGYEERAGQLIMSLAKDFGIQFLIITQIKQFRVGKIVLLEKP